MSVTIVRVRSTNLAVLAHVDPECFDDPVDLERAARCVASDDAILTVAVADGCVVGQCLAVVHRHPDKATELYIDDLAVSPRFQRQGIASQLVETCIREARALGAVAVWVATEADNDAATQLYRALGLTPRTALVFEADLPAR